MHKTRSIKPICSTKLLSYGKDLRRYGHASYWIVILFQGGWNLVSILKELLWKVKLTAIGLLDRTAESIGGHQLSHLYWKYFFVIKQNTLSKLMKMNKSVLYSHQSWGHSIQLDCYIKSSVMIINASHISKKCTKNVSNSYLRTIAKPKKSSPCSWEWTSP